MHYLTCGISSLLHSVNLTLLSSNTVKVAGQKWTVTCSQLSNGDTLASSPAKSPVCLWTGLSSQSAMCGRAQLPSSFRQPHSVHCPPGSPHPAHITSSQSPPSLPLSITPWPVTPSLKPICSSVFSSVVCCVFYGTGLGPDSLLICFCFSLSLCYYLFTCGRLS